MDGLDAEISECGEAGLDVLDADFAVAVRSEVHDDFALVPLVRRIARARHGPYHEGGHDGAEDHGGYGGPEAHLP